MPGITQYVLKGGPCDGKHGDITPAIADTGVIQCQNHLYRVTDPPQHISGRLEFADAGRVQPPPDTATSAHTHRGWNDLRHSVNHNMPAALRASHKSTQAALRSLGRGRKVHR